MTGSATTRTGRGLRLGALGLAAVLIFAGCGSSDGGASERPLTLVVAPHPDDEPQAWGALPDDRGAGDVVHLFLTSGEQSAFCEPDLPGLDAATGERPPEPTPEGRFTDTCRQARGTSTLRFLAAMHDHDPASPVADPEARTAGPFPTDGAKLCRYDGDDTCVEVSPTVAVHESPDGAPVLFVDLGDGDVTVEETEWAIRTVVDHRDELGIDPDRPLGDLVAASYANVDQPGCWTYDHPDHVAVSTAVRTVDLGAFTAQVAPVCSTEPGAEAAPADPDLFATAFEVDGDRRVGPHVVEYGWLLDPYWEGDPGPGQSTLFHADQWFVRSFERADG